MPKQTGIPIILTVQDSGGVARDISTDVRNFNVNGSNNLLETTGLDKSAIERLNGLSDVEFTMNGVFNPDAAKSHAVLSNFEVAPAAGRQVVVDYGVPIATFNVRFSSYNITRGDDGALTWVANGMLCNGLVIAWS